MAPQDEGIFLGLSRSTNECRGSRFKTFFFLTELFSFDCRRVGWCWSRCQLWTSTGARLLLRCRASKPNKVYSAPFRKWPRLISRQCVLFPLRGFRLLRFPASFCSRLIFPQLGSKPVSRPVSDVFETSVALGQAARFGLTVNVLHNRAKYNCSQVTSCHSVGKALYAHLHNNVFSKSD